MKQWIDKTWAKVTAFCLLLVFTVLAIAGGAGITYLVAENAYLDGGEQLSAQMYEGLCRREMGDAYLYLENAQPAFTVPPTEEYAAMFARDFQSSPCSVQVRKGDTVLLSNCDPPESTLYTVFGDYPCGGQTVTIVSSLDPDRAELNYEQVLTARLIRWRHALIVLEVLFAAAWLFCLIFTLASAGHWRGYEGIHLTWFDKIPVDLWLAGFVLALAALGEPLFYVFFYNVAAAAVLVLLFYLFLPAFTAQCKAGTVLKGSVIAWVLRLLRHILRWFGYVLARIPLVWKTVLGVAVLLLFDLFCVANNWDAEFLIAMLAVNLLAGLFLIYLAIGLRKLQKGGQALAAGNYESPVDTRRLVGDFRHHGEDLNAIQQGVQRAVAQQMRSERMKTELITNVSHDIKTPLTSIVNYVDLLKKEEIDNPTAREYIDVLDRQSARLRKLTEDLVEASKAAAGAIPVTLTETDVNVFLTQAAGEYRQRLAENSLEPVLTLDKSDPRIRADGKLLWRVLDNLLSNVCKYAMPGTRVYLSSETAEGKVRVTVKNISRYPLNISADELTERFVRGDESRSTEGSGLGLSIAMGLTHLQKGEFRLSVDGDLFKAQLEFDRL